jgi:type I restriction enzyme S subunit
MSATNGQQVPSGWTVKTIEEVAEVNPRLSKDGMPDNLPVSFVPMPAVGAGDGTIDVSRERPFSEVKKGFTPFQEGDVLFAKITPCMENGKIAVVPKLKNGYGFGSTEFHVLRPSDGMDARYLYYYVSNKSFRAEAQHYMSGAVGQKRVPTAYLKECKIPVAPPDQQKRIVAEIEKQFSRLDEAVANLKRVKANLKRYKAAVLKAAVEGKLTEEWRKAHPDTEPASELLKRILAERRAKWNGKGNYKEPVGPDTTNLLALPKGWAWATVGQLAEIGSGNTPANILGHLQSDGPIPWYKVGDMNRPGNERVMRSAEGYLSQEAVEKLGLKLFPPGTIIFPKRGGAIATNKKRQLMAGSTTDLNVMGLTPDSSVHDYFRWWFSSIDLASLSDGSNVPQVNNKDVLPLTVPLPPLAEQERIVAEVERRLSVVEDLEEAAEANFLHANRLCQAILQQSFSGQLFRDYPVKPDEVTIG